MRALVDIDEQQIKKLDALAKRHNRSRAYLIRQAAGEYLNHALTTARGRRPASGVITRRTGGSIRSALEANGNRAFRHQHPDRLSQRRHEGSPGVGLYSTKAISIVTWIEILLGVEERVESETIRFLDRFELIPPNADVSARAVQLRRENRIRLADAIIWASADTRSMLLVTRNTKDFGQNRPGVRIPYSL